MRTKFVSLLGPTPQERSAATIETIQEKIMKN
jgi:hypothetical protein